MKLCRKIAAVSLALSVSMTISTPGMPAAADGLSMLDGILSQTQDRSPARDAAADVRQAQGTAADVRQARVAAADVRQARGAAADVRQARGAAADVQQARVAVTGGLQPNGGGQQAQDDGKVYALDFGPGVSNLSLGDLYAPYQWALKNDGEFQLIQLKEKFDPVDYLYQGAGYDYDSIGMPQPGPGNYESVITQAIPGMDINIKPAWELYDQAPVKRQVTVAVIDTGIDYSHPDLADAVWTNPGEIPGDGIDNDGNGFVDDIHGWNFYSRNNVVFEGEEDSHGTHAAGTIAATKGANGIAGIADNNFVKVMPIKALGGSDGSGTPVDVIQAIRYAEANGATICNLSLGTSSYNEELAQTIRDSKMLFIVACGNGSMWGDGYNTDFHPVYPASFPFDNIIAVSNIMFDGNLSEESNYGTSSVDIAAPGTYILSTIPGGEYGFMSGTSMAAPMVTGVAALLYSYRPDISLADVKNILINSARKMDSLSGKVVSGGMLDAYAALTYQ